MARFKAVRESQRLTLADVATRMGTINLSAVGTTLVFLTGALPLAAEPPASKATVKAALVSDKNIEALLEPIRQKYKVPGIVAGIVKNDGLAVAGAVGIRKVGSPQAITVNDKLHLGSDTKAMTATLLAELVERKKLSWDSTVGDIFPRLKAGFHADFRGVTLAQLLTHRAGLPANGDWWSLGKGSVVNQRETLLKTMLASAPVDPPGTKFLYSNVGYAIAGHMAEQVTGKSWEQLITARLFKTLGMSSAGFGAPGPKDHL